MANSAESEQQVHPLREPQAVLAKHSAATQSTYLPRTHRAPALGQVLTISHLAFCYGLNCAPILPNLCVKVITLRTSECDCIWGEGL